MARKAKTTAPGITLRDFYEANRARCIQRAQSGKLSEGFTANELRRAEELAGLIAAIDRGEAENPVLA